MVGDILHSCLRGYVARNMYKKLIKDEREKMEDQQKAAVEIQR